MLRQLLNKLNAFAENADAVNVTGSAEQVNEFGFRLLAEAVALSSNRNVFLSPVSIAAALLLVRFGASGETQKEMDAALSIESLSEKEITDLCRAIHSAFACANDQLELTMSNAIWAEKRGSLNAEFVNTARTLFDAEISAVDFNHSQTVQRINDWANEKTSGKIPRIIDNLAGASLVLTNAVYFLGNWARQFRLENTREVPYHLSDGSTRNHPLMFQSGKFSYYEEEKFQAIKLPYAGDSISLIAFLPAEASSLQEFCQALNERSFNKWMREFSEKPGNLGLPKFEARYEETLNQTLINLGMPRAFSSEAEFDRIYTDGKPLCISEVKHKAFVKVNEQGTEAAAVTAVVMLRSAPFKPTNTFTMIVDRPFFFVIREEQTGLILFAGLITNPAQS